MKCTTRTEQVAKKTKPNGEEMREIVVLAVADDEHGCGSSGGKGRRYATRECPRGARTQLPETLGQLRRTGQGPEAQTPSVEDGKPAVGGEKVTRA